MTEGFAEHYYSNWFGYKHELGVRFPRLRALWDTIAVRVEALPCTIHGHALESVGADAENGREFLECTRCGWFERIQF
jgi:hypothetical protein